MLHSCIVRNTTATAAAAAAAADAGCGVGFDGQPIGGLRGTSRRVQGTPLQQPAARSD